MAANTAINNSGELYINGLETFYLTDTTIQLNAGQCRDSTNNNDISLDNNVIINTALTGAGGVDNGILSNVQYKIYVIADSTQYRPTAGILSENYTAPALPFGYDMFRFVGWAKVSSSLVTKFRIIGESSYRKCAYDTNVLQLTAGAATSYTDVVLSNIVGDKDTVVTFSSTYSSAVDTNVANIKPFGDTNAYAVLSSSAIGSSSTPLEVPSVANGSGIPTISYQVVTGDALSLGVKSFDFYL